MKFLEQQSFYAKSNIQWEKNQGESRILTSWEQVEEHAQSMEPHAIIQGSPIPPLEPILTTEPETQIPESEPTLETSQGNLPNRNGEIIAYSKRKEKEGIVP